MRILVVDDSVVFRSQIKAVLEATPGIEVVGVAPNGKLAIEKMQQVAVDLVTLDMEMPVMDGLGTLAEMRKLGIKARAIVFTAHSGVGAATALEALRLGAVDFVAKPTGVTSFEKGVEAIKAQLLPKVLQFGASAPHLTPGSSLAGRVESIFSPVPTTTTFARTDIENMRVRAVVIGSSTGGPNALETIFAMLGGRKVTVPIIVAQHMPPLFTKSLATRIQNISGVPCDEVQNGEALLPGKIYIAPGDFHTTVSLQNNTIVLLNDQGPKRNSVRPAVDNLFESASKVFGAQLLAFVLTGMGEDGAVGCRAIKGAGGGVVIQDQATSIVWGMPGAVHQAGAFDKMAGLADCGQVLVRRSSTKREAA